MFLRVFILQDVLALQMFWKTTEMFNFVTLFILEQCYSKSSPQRISFKHYFFKLCKKFPKYFMSYNACKLSLEPSSESQITTIKEGDIELYIKLIPKVFRSLIVIYRKIEFVYHHWGWKSIDRPLFYPFRSLNYNLSLFIFLLWRGLNFKINGGV